MKVALTEFIGTFFLVLTIGLAIASASPFAPLAIGGMLMVMVYMGGHISGAHYNPAVSTALLIRGALPAKSYLPYVLSQIAGATAGAFVSRVITGVTFAPTPSVGATTMAALLVEILFTFALALVVLNVAVSKRVQGNSYYGLAIGFTVMVGAFVGGGISGGAFNPAVGIGPTIINTVYGQGNFAALWMFIVGPIAGAALAAFVYGIQDAQDPATK